jgi:hypothetical protein
MSAACVACGANLSGRRRVYCSDRCDRRSNYLKARVHVDHHEGRQCLWCGKEVPAYADGQMGRSRHYCSTRCTIARNKANTRRRRKAIDRGSSHAETLDVISVFNDAGWRCQTCGCTTPRSLMGKNQWNSPELDHIVPCWSGGAHVRANVQLLCRRCNVAKAKVEHAEWQKAQPTPPDKSLQPFDRGPAATLKRRISFEKFS